MKRILNVGVVGGGSFGTALGTVAARSGHNVKIFSGTPKTIEDINKLHKNNKFFPDITLPHNLTASGDIDEVLGKADIIIHAIPVQSSYEFIKQNSHKLKENTPYVIASKGILLKQKKFFSQVWDEVTVGKKIPHCILSGPSFAIEIMKDFPTLVTIGCKDNSVAKFLQHNLFNTTFRAYTTTDVIGVEIGGALKNPLAIAAGIVEGKGLGFNTSTALVTRGIYEMSLFSQKFGGKPETLYGLSGIGDVMLTCLGSLSRNKAVGIKLAQGMNLDEIIKSSKEVAEGIPTLLVLGEIIKENYLNMPIMNTLYRIVKQEVSVDEAAKELMGRRLEEELELKI